MSLGKKKVKEEEHTKVSLEKVEACQAGPGSGHRSPSRTDKSVMSQLILDAFILIPGCFLSYVATVIHS